MFSRVLIISTIFCSPNTLAVVGEESAILSALLSEQIQAVAGISQIVRDGKEQLEEIKKLEEAHEAIENKRIKIQRAYYYTQLLGKFGDERQRIKSLVEVRNNLQDAKELVDSRHDLTLGEEILVFSSDHANETASLNLEKKSFHKQELSNMRSQLSLAKNTGTSTKIAAAGAVFTANQLIELNENLSKLIAYQGNTQLAMAFEQERRNHNEYQIKKRWGIIPNISYEEYRKLNKPKKKRGSSEQLQ